jgi:hypothetical protein
MTSDVKVPATKPIQKRMAIFLIAHLVDAPLQPAAATTPTPPPVKDKLPYGTPVAGHPGFVKSPFAPDDGEVDLRGFLPNTEVKCPYTGKIFLVP